jgi:SNF2 family DNA or RNA helicase
MDLISGPPLAQIIKRPAGFDSLLNSVRSIDPGPDTWYNRHHPKDDTATRASSVASSEDYGPQQTQKAESPGDQMTEGVTQSPSANEVSLTNMEKAYKLLRQGLDAEDAFTSSKHAILETPSCFTDVDPDIELYWHQKSGIGYIDHVLWSEEVQPKSILLAWEMSLGKTMTMLAVMHQRRLSGKLTQDRLKGGGTHEGPMLLVLPNKLLQQWTLALEELSPPIDTIIYDKQGRTVAELQSHELVVTTFSRVMRDFCGWHKTKSNLTTIPNRDLPAKSSRIHEPFPLFCIEFACVWADEVDEITNLEALVTQAMCAIQTQRRCGATGTPLLNDYRNVHALLSWLRIEPWSDWDFFKSVG